MSNIAKNIRQYREEHNLTQQELALKLRIGTKKIEKYESGESVPDTQTFYGFPPFLTFQLQNS